jgi:hypothetical protein
VKYPPQLEDIDRANIRLLCANAQCSKEFFKTGAWLKRQGQIICPACGFAQPLDDNKRLALFSDHVQKARQMIARMRTDPH